MKKIYGNKQLLDVLAGMAASGRTAHSLLICGEKGSGRKLIAKYYTQALMCSSPENGRPCDCYIRPAADDSSYILRRYAAVDLDGE